MSSLADELDAVDPRTRTYFPSALKTWPADPPRQQEALKVITSDDIVRSSQPVKLLKSGGALKRGSKDKRETKVNALQLPRDLAPLLPDVEYFAELTADGILFRPATKPASRNLPEWAKKSNGFTPHDKR
jgi:hypothetical protein